MKKAPKSCGCVTLSRSVLRKAELNSLNCSDEKKREHFSENFHSLSVLKYGICSPFPLKNCSNRGFSGLEVATSLHRGFMGEFLILFIELEKQFILLNISMKLRTRILRI